MDARLMKVFDKIKVVVAGTLNRFGFMLISYLKDSQIESFFPFYYERG